MKLWSRKTRKTRKPRDGQIYRDRDGDLWRVIIGPCLVPEPGTGYDARTWTWVEEAYGPLEREN